MHTRTATALTAAGLLLALTSCSNDGNDKASAPSPTATTAASTPSEDPTPEPTPTVLDVGATWEFENTTDGIEGAVTVLGYKQGFKSVGSAAEEAGTPGYEWAYLELKTCSITGTFAATAQPWTLAYEDGARVESSSTTYGDFPKPEFPVEVTLTEGKCVRGKLVFPVPGDQRPTTVVYAPAGLDIPTEWTAPAQ
ncbi:hypothetical protein [Streptomyces sp. NPDC048438]|uniref:hypothetical protein n=1 Tax=Streptomyces sp. NPDC048438 TaxID=3365551 RepID=UPI003718B596